eukprot:3150334-Ditylum_brightwellii.AAC.1
MGRDRLNSYTSKIVTCLVISSCDQSTNLALQCMIECVALATSTNGGQTFWCDDVKHQNLVMKFFSVQHKIVGCARHNHQLIVHGFSCSFYTVTVVLSAKSLYFPPITLILLFLLLFSRQVVHGLDRQGVGHSKKCRDPVMPLSDGQCMSLMLPDYVVLPWMSLEPLDCRILNSARKGAGGWPLLAS